MLGVASARIAQPGLDDALLTAAGAYHSATSMLGFASARITQLTATGAESEPPPVLANATVVMSASVARMASVTLRLRLVNLWRLLSMLIVMSLFMVFPLLFHLVSPVSIPAELGCTG
jgi:hypothetical protein